MSTIEKLTKVFQQVFDDDSIVLTPQTTANDIDDWDSLSHVNLILAVENQFNIRFTQKELLQQKNVGDLIKGIDNHSA